jgi:hypothetical protein
MTPAFDALNSSMAKKKQNAAAAEQDPFQPSHDMNGKLLVCEECGGSDGKRFYIIPGKHVCSKCYNAWMQRNTPRSKRI